MLFCNYVISAKFLINDQSLSGSLANHLQQSLPSQPHFFHLMNCTLLTTLVILRYDLCMQGR